ncbi:hypothetical protein [Micromonospora parathelypteridis]|uniref:Uncharacterized protein n=1 Tax=Micromonospora parathelypteridis TaxID=1839617 RepID=A0A840W355_9ACTN|nr:hypothetical protein [Micromonospora parathelypteridis]MBB5479220.1 hypothetical protein [Micromonospora parathelypteridis]GGO02384.1 hypothetical protein GCM10011576_01800 [Micromonospora parathelypteridis]
MSRALSYYLIYRTDQSTAPAGLFVIDPGQGEALLWDHRRGAWAYDPGLVTRFLDDYRNLDRYESVNRMRAEQVAQAITGVPALPDETAFRMMLAAGAAGYEASLADGGGPGITSTQDRPDSPSDQGAPGGAPARNVLGGASSQLGMGGSASGGGADGSAGRRSRATWPDGADGVGRA